jgi:hypothetical protein
MDFTINFRDLPKRFRGLPKRFRESPLINTDGDKYWWAIPSLFAKRVAPIVSLLTPVGNAPPLYINSYYAP